MLNHKFYETIEVLLFISMNSGGKPVSSRVICQKQNIVSRHLEPILQELVHNNILKASKGPRGGYSLAKEKRRITLLEIHNIIEKTSKSKKDPFLRSNHFTNVVQEFSVSLEDKINKFLDEITLDDIYNSAESSISLSKPDFII